MRGRRRWFVASVTGVALAVASAMCVGVAGAQSPNAPTLTGRVVGPDSQPVVGATIRVMQGAVSHVVRTTDAGRYRIAPMADGSWTVAIQAVGYVAFFERLTFAGPSMERDFVLKRVQTELAPVFIEGNWSGVRGFVVDERGFAPLKGARILVLSQGGEELITDTSGRFTIEKPEGYGVRLLVEREGYARRLVMAKATRLAAEQLVIRLDTNWDPRKDWLEWEDLKSRVRMASPMAALVSGDEIRAAGAIGAAPKLVGPGIRLDGCAFVNGVAKPSGFYADLKEIDFVEVYPAGSDHSGTLARRWPIPGECSVARGKGPEAGRSGSGPFIVIWLKTPPPPPPVSKTPALEKPR